MAVSKQRSKEIGEFVANNWGELSIKDIEKELGISKQTVINHAVRLGLPVLNSRESLARYSKSVDVKFFESWSNEMAYVLGYVWADGCTSSRKLSFNCTPGDDYIIYKIKSLLGSKHTVGSVPPGTDNRGWNTLGGTKLQVTNSYLVNTLINMHGVLPAKSEQDLEMSNVPEEYLSSFARGFMDGDGFVSVKGGKYVRIGFLGTRKFTECLQNRIALSLGIPKNGLSPQPKESGRILWEFGWGAFDDVDILAKWLYSDGSNLFIERKRNTLVEWGHLD